MTDDTPEGVPWLLLIGSVVVALAASEVALAAMAPTTDPYADLKDPAANHFIRSDRAPDREITVRISDSLPGLPDEATFTTNGFGFRGGAMADPKPEDEFRVFLVGGSTVEGFVLDDSVALHTVMQRELEAARKNDGPVVRIYNAGVSGHRSDDHVSLVSHRLLHLDPDLVVVMAGANDLVAAIHGHDYLHYDRDYTATDERLDGYLLAKMLATELQLPRRLHHALRALRGGREGRIVDGIAYSDYARARERLRSDPVVDELPDVETTAFAENLRTMVGAVRAHGAEAMLATHPSSWDSDVDPGISRLHWLRNQQGTTYAGEAMADGLERFNDATRRVAREMNVALADLAARIPRSSEAFYDDVHFNVRGAELAAQRLAGALVDACGAAGAWDERNEANVTSGAVAGAGRVCPPLFGAGSGRPTDAGTARVVE